MNENIQRFLQRRSSIKVTPYSPEYRDQVLELAHEMHAESVVHRHIPMNDEKVLAQLEAAAKSQDCYFRLAVRGDEVIGGFISVPSVLYFSDDKVMCDRAWFVKRNRRGTYAAVMLINDWRQWGRARGVKWFFLGQSTGVDMETTAELYKRLGFAVVGVNSFCFDTVKEV